MTIRNFRSFIGVCFFFIFLLSKLFAENITLTSPYHTISAHLKYTSKENYKPELAAQTIFPVSRSTREMEHLAISLRQIINAKGLVIKLNSLPQDENYLDSVSGKHRYTPFASFPEIYLEKIGGKWYYSKETAEAIPILHKNIFRFNTHKILQLLPKIGANKFLGVFIWQIYGFIGLLIVSYTFFILLRLLLGLIVFRILVHFIPKELSKKFIKPLARPFSILASVIFFLLFLPLLQFDAAINHKIIIIGKVLISIFAMLLFYHLVDLLNAFMMKAAKKTESTLDDQLVPLITKTLKIIVVIIGILFILQNLHFKITALLAGISIGGLAIAFAAQDSIKNFFGSLLIFLDKPFQIGDWIISPEVNGIVEEIGFRSTRIRTLENSLLTIPNGKLADQPIDNMGLRVFRRYKTMLSVTYDTPVSKLNLFIEGLKQLILAHPQTRHDNFVINVAELSHSSINILFQIYILASDYPSEMKYRHEILTAILKLADELKIRWAFPTQTLFVEEFPGQPSLTPIHQEDQQRHKNKLSSIINTLKKSFTSDPIPEIKHVKTASHEVHLDAPSIITQSGKMIRKKGKELLTEEITEIANTLKISPDVFLALIKTETKQKSFLPDGRPSIIFQGHRFWKELQKRNIDPLPLAEKYPEIIYQNYNRKFIREGEKEYDRLEKAKAIHKEAAYLSTQWGMFALSGNNFKEFGFNSVNEMVHHFYKTENEQLTAFVNLLKSKQAIDDIRKSDWMAYGKKIHGKNFNVEKFGKIFEENLQKIHS